MDPHTDRADGDHVSASVELAIMALAATWSREHRLDMPLEHPSGELVARAHQPAYGVSVVDADDREAL